MTLPRGNLLLHPTFHHRLPSGRKFVYIHMYVSHNKVACFTIISQTSNALHSLEKYAEPTQHTAWGYYTQGVMIQDRCSALYRIYCQITCYLVWTQFLNIFPNSFHQLYSFPSLMTLQNITGSFIFPKSYARVTGRYEIKKVCKQIQSRIENSNS